MRAVPVQAVNRARHLRRAQTDAERLLWARLRARQLSGAKFRRQRPIGPYLADFCCYEAALIVEVDGGQHADHLAADHVRTQYLQSCGFRVLRFWNTEVLNHLDAVLEAIATALRSAPRGGE